jgi:parallel beta-helix repeat protein
MNSVDASNTVVGKPVYYFVNQSDMVISPSAYPEIGYLSFVNCVNVTVKGLDLTSNLRGLLLAFTNDSKIADNNVASNGDGIYLFCSSNDTLSGNRVKDNDWSGICLCSSDNTTLITNDVTNNNIGIYVCYYSNDNVLSGNQVTGNWYGIFLGYSSSNILLSNTVIENYKYGFRATLSQSNVLTGNNVTRNGEGISLYSSSDNRIFHNNIVNNSRNVVTEDSKNIWDDGYPSGGNYWSDYAGIDLFGGLHQNASGSDWIGDSPFIIDPSNFDRYPLMNAYVSELEEIRAAYRALLLTQNQILSALESLNLTVMELTGNLSDMQKKSDNAASELDATRMNLQTQMDSLNQTCTGLNQSIADLQAQMGSVNSTLQASVNRLDNQLNNVLSVLYALTVTTIVLATVTVYLGTRKPKAKP